MLPQIKKLLVIFSIGLLGQNLAALQQSQAGGCRLKAVGPETATATITAADYCEFLNAVATTDPQNLYDEKMESDLAGACVTRAGEPGSYRYANQAEGCRPEAVGPETATAVTFISAEDVAQYCSWKNNSTVIALQSKPSINHQLPTTNLSIDYQLKSNQLEFQLIDPAAPSNLTIKASKPGSDSWEEKLAEIGVGFGMILGGGDESETPESSESPPENSGQDSSSLATFNGMNIRENQYSISAALRTDMAATAATAETAPAGNFNSHDIRAIAPNIDNMSQIVGVDHRLVHNWVLAGLINDTATQEATLHQIVQIIEKRTGTMTGQALADLKNDLAARSLEAQGGSSLANNKEAFTTLAEEKQDHPWLVPGTAAATEGSPCSSVGRTTLLANLQERGLGNLVPDFLIGDPATQKKEVQEKYTEALIGLRNFSPEIADAMAQEPLPKTDKEAQAVLTRLKSLIQQAIASENAERITQLNQSTIRVHGLKAALNVLDAATAHKERFLGALGKNTDPRMNQFYHGKIDNINKTIQNLQGAAASILQTTESIITNYSRLGYTFGADRMHFLQSSFDNAHFIAREIIHLSTQYAEAIRAQSPQAARLFAQAATYRNTAEATYDNNQPLGLQYKKTSDASLRAAEATAAGKQPVAELYTQEATYFRNAAEARLANNEPLAIQWNNAGVAFSKAAEATAAGHQDAAARYIQAATYFRNAAEARLANNEPLAMQWSNTALASFKATEAYTQPIAELYIQAATYFRNAVEALLAKNEPLAIQWNNAGAAFFEAARARHYRLEADADRFAAEAEAIARSIDQTWGEWAVQTFLSWLK